MASHVRTSAQFCDSSTRCRASRLISGHGKPCPYAIAFCVLVTGCARQNIETPNATTPNANPTNIEYSKSSGTNQIVIGQFLDGQTPLSLRLKDLSSDWKRIEINGGINFEINGEKTAKTDDDDFPIALLREISGAQHGVYFTQWKTVAQNNDTFLLCYRAGDFDEGDIRTLFTKRNAKSRESSKPSASQWMGAISQWLDQRPLDLVLLNLKNIKVVGNARAVNWSQDLEQLQTWAKNNLPDASFRDASTRLSSRERLQLLANATLRWARGNDGVLPALDDASQLQREVSPLVFSATWWRDAQNQAFVANSVLSRKKIAHISSPQDMILWYQRDAGANGTRAVAFLDGSARDLGAQEWEKYRKGSKIR